MLDKAGDGAPVAPKKEHVSEYHGQRLEDPYHWLKAENWQQVMRDPSVLPDDIRAYLEAENAHTSKVMDDTEAFQEKLFKEMKGRIKEDDSSVPTPDGAYAYGVKYIEGGQHPIYTRSDRDGGNPITLIDGNKEAKDKAYLRIGGVSHSDDHGTVAWSYDDNGSEFFKIRFREPGTGTDADTIIDATSGSAVWSADGKYVFYTRLDENHRPSKLYRHEIGAPTESDVLVHEEPDPGFFLGCGRTQSGNHIVIDCHDHETSELRLFPADDPTAEPRLIAPRETGLEYDIDERGGILYILTNADGAEDFKIVTAPIDAPDRENWKDLIPHEPGRLILSHCTYQDYFVRLERVNGLPRIVIHFYEEAREEEIAFDEEAYSLGLSGGYEFETDIIRFSYSSMTTPSQVFDYNVKTRERTLRKEQEVPSGHNAADYVTKRIFAPARDGEEIPVTLIHHKDTPVDGTAPVWLYGYGSYGIAIPAGFSTSRLSLVGRGFIYAIAHIRGGKDKGYNWYKQGKREHKQNTFRDFIDAAAHIADAGIGAPDKIIAQGGSAGGMLMGAISNMAPEKFLGIIAEVPFVDVLNTMLDDTLPLTPPEWPEWGNPIASIEAFEEIAAYSPYDNVTAQNYPHILAVAGLTDPRVTYWEPAKWVAKLRTHKNDDNLLLLKTNMESGHGGASGRFDSLKELALVYAFGLKVAGIRDAVA